MTPLQSILTQLDEIKARAEKATPGPWRLSPNTSDWLISISKDVQDNLICDAPFGRGEYTAWERNWPLIAHSRTDVPRLVEALRVAVVGLESLSPQTTVREEKMIRESLSRIHEIMEGGT